MKRYLFSFLLMMSPFISFSQEIFSLEIEIESIKNIQGSISICLVREEKDFLESCFIGDSIPVKQEDVRAIFTELPEGVYAVSVYHDEDNNGKLNVGKLLPIPTEKYGFSNNPDSTFGPPKFEDCMIELNRNLKITIKL